MTDNNRSRLLLLLLYLFKNTDEEHVASVADLIKMLGEHDIIGNRNTIRDDINALIRAGFDIQHHTGPSNSKLYYFGSLFFDNNELSAIIKAISAYEAFDETFKLSLIEKLYKQTSIFNADNLKQATDDTFNDEII